MSWYVLIFIQPSRYYIPAVGSKTAIDIGFFVTVISSFILYCSYYRSNFRTNNLILQIFFDDHL